MHQIQNFTQDVEAGNDFPNKANSKKSVTYGNVLNVIYKLVVAGASIFGLGYITFGLFRGSSSNDSNNNSALTIKREKAGLIPVNRVPSSSASDIFGAIFKNSKQASQSSRWISEPEEKQEEKLPKLNFVENTRLEVREASESPILLKNELAIAKGESVIITQEHLDAYKNGTAPTDLKFEISELTGGQFKRNSTGMMITTFTLQDVIDKVVEFIPDGGFIAPAYKVRAIDENDLTATDFESVSITFFEKKIVKVGEVQQINDYGFYFYYSAIKLPNNRTLVAYGAKISDNEYQIRGQLLYPNEELCGSGFIMISHDRYLRLRRQALDFFSDNKIILVFYREDTDGIRNSYYKIFHPADIDCTPLLQYNPITKANIYKGDTVDYYSTFVAVLRNKTETNEEFIVGWYENYPLWSDLAVRKFTKDGGPIMDVVVLVDNTNTTTYTYRPLVSIFNNKNFLFSYRSYNDTADLYRAGVIITDNNLGILTPEFYLYKSPDYDYQSNQYRDSNYKDSDDEEIVVLTHTYNSTSYAESNVFLHKIYENGTQDAPIEITNKPAMEGYPYMTKLKDYYPGDEAKKIIVIYSSKRIGMDWSNVSIKVLNDDLTIYDEFENIFDGSDYTQKNSFLTDIGGGKFLVTSVIKKNQIDVDYHIYGQLFALHNECPELRVNLPDLLLVNGSSYIFSGQNFNGTYDRELPRGNISISIGAGEGGRVCKDGYETTLINNFTLAELSDGIKVISISQKNITLLFSATDGDLTTTTVLRMIRFKNTFQFPITKNKNIALAIGLGVVALAIAGSLGFTFWYRRKKQRNTYDSQPMTPTSSSESNRARKPKRTNTVPVLTGDQILEVSVYKFNQIIFYEKLNEGAYGAIYKGKVPKIRGFVAIKQLIQSRGDDGIDENGLTFGEFSREITAMHNLSKDNHPNIVKLYGVCLNGLYIIMELMHTSLKTFIYGDKLIPGSTFFKILTGIISGLEFMHRQLPKPIIHRDIKPANILLTKNYTAKLADFGLSKRVERYMTRAVGTPVYIAPEVILKKGRYGVKSDVYSFAITIWEMFSREKPYETIENFMGYVLAGGRLKLPGKWPQFFKDQLSSWWDQDPSKRSEMRKIKTQLPEIEKCLKEEYYGDKWEPQPKCEKQSTDSNTLSSRQVFT